MVLTTIEKTAEHHLDLARLRAHVRCERHLVLDVHLALGKCLNGVFLWLSMRAVWRTLIDIIGYDNWIQIRIYST